MNEMKQLNVEIPEDLGSIFKAECARIKRPMGGKEGVLTALMQEWLRGEIEV